jgi:hypothetical protein
MSSAPGFKLIVLSEVERPVRLKPLGVFSLIQFRSRTGLAMASGMANSPARDFAEWLSPTDALAVAHQAFGSDATNVIWERLCGGVIKAFATTMSLSMPPSAEPQLNPLPSEIPARYWASHFSREGSSNFWRSGDARFFFSANDRRTAHSTVIRCFGIKLDPKGIAQMLGPGGIKQILQDTPIPAKDQSSPLASDTRNRGGRPRKDFWDALWAEMCGQIYEGALIPKRQADIEKAMLDWATNHGHDLSEAGVRPRARILFNRLKNARLKT